MYKRRRQRKLVHGFSVWSRLSFLSVGILLSAGSILSIGCAGSVLSIGSAGSILSIGSAGGILSIGGHSLLAARRDGGARRRPWGRGEAGSSGPTPS
ncbi:MAG TPA: hypothetical protein VIP52_06995 [Candidatus Dormibacteraeota bacterium]